MTYKEEIARIKDTYLGWEDHGHFIANLSLDYGGAGQGAGNYDLRSGNKAFQFIAGVLSACGVDSWEKVKGRTVFAIVSDGLVRGLKPLPTEPGKEFIFADAVND